MYRFATGFFLEVFLNIPNPTDAHQRGVTLRGQGVLGVLIDYLLLFPAVT